MAVTALTALALSACAAGQITQTAGQVPNIDGAHGAVGQVKVLDALLATPDGPSYPKGSSVPLQFWMSNADPVQADTLTAIMTEAGPVTISGTAMIPPNSIVQVGSGASITATITDVTHELHYGMPVRITFSFAHAGKVSLRVPIKVPDHRTTPRATTNIYPEPPPNLWETTYRTSGTG